MAKPKKDDQTRSVLKVAYEAFERGDAIQARSLAKEVLAGKVGRDDEKVAAELGPQLSIEGAVVEGTPAAVAKELISRTIVAPPPYLFVGVILAAFVTLVIIATLRYRA